MIKHIALIVAVALAGAIVLLITGRRQREQQRTRLDVNRELYQQRKLELVQERADGLLTEEAFARANAELDKRFVTENTELEQVHDQQVGRSIWIPAVLVVLTTEVLYSLFGSWSLQRQADERSEEHTSELQSRENLVCRLLLEKKNKEFVPT